MKIFGRLGIRACLILAFVGISGFAVLATLAATYSFQPVQMINLISVDFRGFDGFAQESARERSGRKV